MKITTLINYRSPSPMRVINIALTTIALLLGCNIAIASTLTDGQFQTIVNGLNGIAFSGKPDFLYERAAYLDNDDSYETGVAHQLYERLQSDHIASLGTPSYVPIITNDITTIIPVYADPKAVGDGHTQSHLIRNQISLLLRRHLIDADNFADTEATQRIILYQNAFNYAVTKNIQYGSRLGLDVDNSPIDMIWPEKRYIDGQEVVVPVVYLTAGTVAANKVEHHEDQFNGVAQFGSIHLNDVGIKAGRDAFLYAAKSIVIENNGYISGLGNLTIEAGEEIALRSGVINSNGNLNLRSGSDFQLVSSTIKSQGDLYVGAHNVVAQTLVHRFDYNGGQGTRFGQIASINSSTGDVFVQAINDIAFYGTNVSAGGGIKLAADGNIYLGTVQGGSSSSYVDGGWKIDTSSVEYLRTFLSAEETISLIAGGQIVVDAAEIVSSSGHIELLAQLGVTIEDETASTQTHQIGKWKKRKQEITEYQSIAVRSILDAGKGVRIHAEFGDVVLKAVDITSREGANVVANNGSVQMLMSKENDYYSYYSKKKGSVRVTTITDGHNIDNAVYTTAVGGLTVQAQKGLVVEYAGDPSLTLDQQIEQISQIKGMEWMAQVRARDDVNWAEVELAYEEWKTKDRTINPAIAAVVTVVIAVCTAGAGLAAAMTTMATNIGMSAAVAAIAGPAMAAGLTTMANQVAIAGLSGNLHSASDLVETVSNDDAIKSLASSMLTAGVMASFGDVAKDGDFFNVKDLANTNVYPTAAQFAAQAEQALVSATVNAGVSTLIYGGGIDGFKDSFVLSLKQNAVNQIGAYMANKIGMAFDHKDELGQIEPTAFDTAMKYVLHAGAGCVIGSATADINNDASSGEGCSSGAGGAVAGEFIGEMYEEKTVEEVAEAKSAVEDLRRNEQEYIEFLMLDGETSSEVARTELEGDQKYYLDQVDILRQRGVDLARLGAALGAFAAGADAAGINIAAATGQNAAENNALFLLAIPIIIKGIDLLITLDEFVDAYKAIQLAYATGGKTAGDEKLVEFLMSEASDRLLEKLIPGGTAIRKSREIIESHVKGMNISSADGLLDHAKRNGALDGDGAAHIQGRVNSAQELAKEAADAANRLGVDLNKISVTNGVGRVKIEFSATLDPRDIKKLTELFKEKGASKVEIESGFIGNDKLDAFLQRRVQDGRPFNGGTVRVSNSNDSDYVIDFEL